MPIHFISFLEESIVTCEPLLKSTCGAALARGRVWQNSVDWDCTRSARTRVPIKHGDPGFLSIFCFEQKRARAHRLCPYFKVLSGPSISFKISNTLSANPIDAQYLKSMHFVIATDAWGFSKHALLVLTAYSTFVCINDYIGNTLYVGTINLIHVPNSNVWSFIEYCSLYTFYADNRATHDTRAQ